MNWQPIETAPASTIHDKNYVLVVDAKGRMAVAYCLKYTTGEVHVVSAKATGKLTHWMPLPEPPKEATDV